MPRTTINDLSGPDLILAFNFLVGKYPATSDDKAPVTVKRFQNREVGADRVRKLAERVGMSEADLMAKMTDTPEPKKPSGLAEAVDALASTAVQADPPKSISVDDKIRNAKVTHKTAKPVVAEKPA